MPKLFVKINSLRQIEFIDKIYLGLEKAVCNHPQAGSKVYFFFDLGGFGKTEVFYVWALFELLQALASFLMQFFL